MTATEHQDSDRDDGQAAAIAIDGPVGKPASPSGRPHWPMTGKPTAESTSA